VEPGSGMAPHATPVRRLNLSSTIVRQKFIGLS
jgi:hypothetical protein